MKTGMIKLIYSDSFDEAVGAGARLIDDGNFIKSASTIFGCDYSDVKPDKEHVGIHVVALGDYEGYGPNRNADSFPKVACEKRHDTFVKNGHVYEHHRNKDSKIALGKIVKSAFNKDMHRVELFIHANIKRAEKHLERMEKDGEVPFSMSCRVPHDRCYVIGTPVLTNNGTRLIEEINIGDSVITKQGNIKPVVEKHYNYFTGQTVSIVGSGVPEITMTDNHPCFIIKKDKLRNKYNRRYAPDGNNFDYIVNKNIGKVEDAIEIVDASTLRVGDYLIVPTNIQYKYSINDNLAYLAGVYAGDGFLIKQRRGRNRKGEQYNRGATISCEYGATSIDKIVISAEQLSTITAINRQSCLAKNEESIILSGKDFATMLKILVGEYSHSKYINLTYFKTLSSRLNFIGGLIDSDGSQDENSGVIRICTSSTKLAYDTLFLCLNSGIKTSLHKEIKKENDGGYKRTLNYIWVICIGKEFSTLLSNYSTKIIAKNNKLNVCIGVNWGGYYCTPITKIKYNNVVDLPVYNLSVVDDETYIAGGVSTHNCSRCQTLRKTTTDPNQCSHVKNELGKMAEDGTITHVFNDEPNWFDISFVTRPADRIAYSMHIVKAASAFVSSTDLAKEAGLLDDEPEILSDIYDRKKVLISDIMRIEDRYIKLGNTKIASTEDRYMWELCKSANVNLSTDTIDKLREYNPEELLSKLAIEYSVILPITDFYKYAYGDNYNSFVGEYIDDAVHRANAGLFTYLNKQGCTDTVLKDGYFEVSNQFTRKPIDKNLLYKVAETLSFNEGFVNDRIITSTIFGIKPKLELIKLCSNNNEDIVNYLLVKYASYKLSMLSKIVDKNLVDKNKLLALSVTQDLFSN